VSVADLFDAIQAELGSKYVNDFTYENHTYHVYVQGDTDFRATFDDLDKIFVTSANGATSPITDFLTTHQVTSPPTITHYNLFRSVEITGQTPPGLGSAQSLGEMENLSKTLPGTFQHEWSGISLEQLQGGGASAAIFALGLLFVFFVLAAQYESLTEPLIILLATPVALLGALVALHMRGLASDVYSQVGFVLLIGLASKNAILIVEFSNQLRSEGRTAIEAVTEAAEIRLRPILMTSFAFILGIVPLVIASGAGAASRHSLGTAILGGMIVSTLLNLAIIPALYLIVAPFDKRHDAHDTPQPPHEPAVAPAGPIALEKYT
jgi:HAE1 family hydrophobic/amphiphilic exporter-1